MALISDKSQTVEYFVVIVLLLLQAVQIICRAFDLVAVKLMGDYRHVYDVHTLKDAQFIDYAPCRIGGTNFLEVCLVKGGSHFSFAHDGIGSGGGTALL